MAQQTYYDKSTLLVSASFSRKPGPVAGQNGTTGLPSQTASSSAENYLEDPRLHGKLSGKTRGPESPIYLSKGMYLKSYWGRLYHLSYIPYLRGIQLPGQNSRRRPSPASPGHSLAAKVESASKECNIHIYVYIYTHIYKYIHRGLNNCQCLSRSS